MKLTIVAVALLATSLVHAMVPELATKMVGKYEAAETDCALPKAIIKVDRINNSDVLMVELRDDHGGFGLHGFDLDNLWNRKKTTIGFRRVKVEERITGGNAIVATISNCSLGWVNCGSDVTDARVALINANSIEASVNQGPTCTYMRVQ